MYNPPPPSTPHKNINATVAALLYYGAEHWWRTRVIALHRTMGQNCNRTGGESDMEERYSCLAAVGSRSRVGHGQDTGSSVSKLEVLVLKLVTVDGLSP